MLRELEQCLEIARHIYFRQAYVCRGDASLSLATARLLGSVGGMLGSGAHRYAPCVPAASQTCVHDADILHGCILVFASIATRRTAFHFC